MTKADAIEEINNTQDFYVNQLISIINHNNKSFDELKEIDFTSPTGTGKTVMMSKLINKMPNYFFVITTLSRGQLRIQIENNIRERIKQNNVLVYGLNEFTKTTKMQLNDFQEILKDKKNIVWIRDEGHIATNRWQEVLREKAIYIINFSATNKFNNGIQCNFTHTMMLRTVQQQTGTMEDALKQLVLVKKSHEKVQGYNPCALFRIMNDSFANYAMKLCEKYKLKAINITEENFDMSELCNDNNEYDVIINKFKITEGIDLKRCHVIYMDNKPGNESTIVQVIGRSRRNALLWRNDIDILDPQNKKLLEDTRRSFVFYNIEETKVEQGDNGELLLTLCDTVSIEDLKQDIDINVENGKLNNGLKILELEGKTGTFHISKNNNYDFNIVNNEEFYKEEIIKSQLFVLSFENLDYNIKKIYFKPEILNYFEKKYKHSGSTVDRRKQIYLWCESYFLKMNIPFDCKTWRAALGIDDIYHKVQKGEWRKFCDFLKTNKYIDNLRIYLNNIPSEIRYETSTKSIVRKKEILDKKNIFVIEKYCSTHIKQDLLPYVESYEIVDLKTEFKIKQKLCEFGIKEINRNSFYRCHHLYTEDFEDMGINSIADLKRKVDSAKGKTILKSSVKYLKQMIDSISNFDDINTYDAEYFDLIGLNKKLNLKLTKKEINSYINQEYKVITKQPKKYDYMYVYRFDKKKNCFVNLMSQEFYIYREDFNEKYNQYEKVINDEEIAIIGPDIMRYSDRQYKEDKNVTSKISKFCKFNQFISKKYKKEMDWASNFYYKNENDLGLDKKCNSCLGFCVEYYAKMKLFGHQEYLKYINDALKESNQQVITDAVLVRAAMLAYRDAMGKCFGSYMNIIIPSITVEQLIQEKYNTFVEAVIFYGNRTFEYLKKKFNKEENLNSFDPDLSVNHISALCDFITKDTIIDLKCTNSITEKHVKQVLAYHYLSTKRNDIDIKNVIVYDAISGRELIINVNPKSFLQ